jgi:hypothetical protein
MNRQKKQMLAKEALLSHADLKARLVYEPLTGLFRWVEIYHRTKIGTVAGNFSGRYVDIKLDQVHYMAHRLAWFYMTGKWPVDEIDHWDTDKHNNRWKNLREATRSQNAGNASPMKNKKYTSLKGVTYAAGRRKWMANIRRDGKNYSSFIGYYDTAEEAHAAYAVKAKELFGHFARTA